jgi:phosphatidylglycerol:prolipoprotein diacylglycerol transferase
MCSELFRIPISYNGVPIFGFGLLLLAWLGVSGYAMYSMARQAGWPEALKAQLPTLLVVAGVVAVAIPKFVPGGVPVRSYGVLVLSGIVAGIAMSVYRARQTGLEADDILSLAVWLIPSGAIGGRLFYVVQYWNERIRQPDLVGTLKNIFAITEGGLVVYGAFAGAMGGFAIFVLRRKLPALALADIVAPGMMAGLAFGRIGCLMNGCCYGGESDATWAITFPRENMRTSLSAPYAEQGATGRFWGLHLAGKAGDPATLVVMRVDPNSPAEKAGVQAGDEITVINGVAATGDAAATAFLNALRDEKPLELATSRGQRTIASITTPPRSLPVHPAQVYSAIDAALLCAVLWLYFPYRRRDGEVMALMLIIHPISRFLLEAIRVDENAVWGTGLSISQNLSIVIFLIGTGMWIFLRRSLTLPRGTESTRTGSPARPTGLNHPARG